MVKLAHKKLKFPPIREGGGVMGGNLRILYTKSVIVFSIYHKVVRFHVALHFRCRVKFKE